jgi:2-pyrone-4,6-dicarboxylate lactonase
MVHIATRPDPNPRTPRLVCPPGSIDTHLHLFGPQTKYTFDPETPFISDDNLAESCIEMHSALGISHGVIVSGGAYGRDHRHLMDSLAQFPEHFRGVAVPPVHLEPAEIERMDQAGVRGIRFVSDSAGHHVAHIEEPIAREVAEFGWHVQFIASGTNLTEHAERLLALPNDLVIDHFGSVPAELGPEQPAFRTLLEMLDTGRVWVKLSGPMYCSKLGFPYPDVQPLADALVRHAPQRLIWGSDWPHLHMNEPTPNDADLLDLLLDWVPDEQLRRRVLVENPAQLYRF